MPIWLLASGFVRAHLLPVVVVVALLASHLWAYEHGKKTGEAAGLRTVIAQQETARVEEKKKTDSEKDLLADTLKQIQATNADTKDKLKRVGDYVHDHPKDPSCNLNDDDVRVLKDVARDR